MHKIIERAYKQAEQIGDIDPDIAKINATYAFILLGGKSVVLKETEDGLFELLGIDAFRQWFANRHVTINKKSIPLGQYWLTHLDRRQYENFVFDPCKLIVPNKYNLWKGFAVTPGQGDCTRFLAHILDNVCGGNNDHFNWVMGWFAAIFQKPAEKFGTSLVLRGVQGVGKTKVGEVIGSLLGPHYKKVANPRYVTGRFNSHLTSCMLLHADEAFWAGDHEAEGTLKDLITSDNQFIEFKGKEPIEVDNFVRLLVCSNHDWVVPAGYEERRFAIFDVGRKHMQDYPYFAAIDAEMKSGGREALLHYLINFDLTKVNPRAIPKTEALLEQKFNSQDDKAQWWLDILMRGALPLLPDVKPPSCLCARLFENYIEHAGRQGVRRRATETNLGTFLKKHLPERFCKTRSRARNRDTVYEFPSLADCRKAFAERLQQELRWPGDGTADWEDDATM